MVPRAFKGRPAKLGVVLSLIACGQATPAPVAVASPHIQAEPEVESISEVCEPPSPTWNTEPHEELRVRILEGLRQSDRCEETSLGRWEVLIEGLFDTPCGSEATAAPLVRGNFRLRHISSGGAVALSDAFSFQRGGCHGENTSFESLGAFDFDGDGATEWALKHTISSPQGSESEVLLLTVNGSGRVTVFEPARALSVTDVVDLNADGRPDLVLNQDHRYARSLASGEFLEEDRRCDGQIEVRAAAASVDARQVRACYERQLRESPTLTGQLRLRLFVDREGLVAAARASSSMDNEALHRCIETNARTWTFPIPSGDVCAVIVAPFNLAPRPSP